ncbi:DUF6968 family protein [Nocardia transvalensis]|uniref:DUF6968 family protein n=1 Tax=Nocardia transvalensis TaxID=37333 RepID=UPI0018953D3A|nr:hypothetical protein [Nocardia transvalensis]MBF6328706.1 hypothetical protein [Nocardia transvalensis]
MAEDGQTVAIEVDKPRPIDSDGAECVFRIDGHERTAHGTDDLTALYGALVQIGELLAEANHDAHRARFVIPAELGFPNQAADHASAPAEMSEVVATRSITKVGHRHLVRIGRPFQADGNQLALCPFHVDDRPLAVAGGWDGMQALLTAVRMIGALLQLPPDWPVRTAP